MDAGNRTSGATVTVDLTATLQENITYYYLVTATAEDTYVEREGDRHFYNRYI